MVRVLHIVSSLGSGGVEACLYAYYTHIDREKIHFDFVVHADSVGMLETEFLEMGSRVVHVTPKKKSLIQNLREIGKVIREGHYDAVHVHQGTSSITSLLLAKRYKVPVKIVHYHDNKRKTGLRGVMQGVLRKAIYAVADWYFACGEEAGQAMYGRLWGVSPKCRLLRNAKDLSLYHMDAEARQSLRASIGAAAEDLVVLHVGRMSDQKNQSFLLDIFAKVHEAQPSAKLVIAGEGPLRQALEQKVSDLGLTEAVHFLGAVRNVNLWYSAADVFMLPSRNEGLPLVAVEAQISGLPVICSTCVPASTAITDVVRFIPLTENLSAWRDAVLEAAAQPRIDHTEAVRAAGYDINTESQVYEAWLLETIGATKC